MLNDNTNYRNTPKSSTDDEELMACAMNIARHLERNIMKNRDVPVVAHKLVGMNKYIHANYINKLHCRD